MDINHGMNALHCIFVRFKVFKSKNKNIDSTSIKISEALCHRRIKVIILCHAHTHAITYISSHSSLGPYTHINTNGTNMVQQETNVGMATSLWRMSYFCCARTHTHREQERQRNNLSLFLFYTPFHSLTYAVHLEL